MPSTKKTRAAKKRPRSAPTVKFTPAVLLPLPQSRAPSSPPPLCESQLAKVWRKYERDHSGQEHILDGFLCRWRIFGGELQREVVAWVKAGAPHVCANGVARCAQERS